MADEIEICENRDGKDVCIKVGAYKLSQALNQDDVAKIMFNMLNYGRGAGLKEAISERLIQEHPTIQQNFFRAMSGVTEEFSRKAIFNDARSEASKKWADIVVEATRDIRFPFI